jgi:hypothetical protein
MNLELKNYHICFIQVELDLLYSLFRSWQLSFTCFWYYQHPSSGAQLQRTAIGFVSVENRCFSIKWCEGLFYVDLCVLVFQNLVWYLCACVCHWICFVIAWSWCVVSSQIVRCAIFVYLRFGVFIPLEQVLVLGHFSTVSYRLVREGFARRVLGFRVVVVAFGL